MSAELLAAMLNEFGVKPESGAPMLIAHEYRSTRRLDLIQWDLKTQKWTVAR